MTRWRWAKKLGKPGTIRLWLAARRSGERALALDLIRLFSGLRQAALERLAALGEVAHLSHLDIAARVLPAADYQPAARLFGREHLLILLAQGAALERTISRRRHALDYREVVSFTKAKRPELPPEIQQAVDEQLKKLEDADPFGEEIEGLAKKVSEYVGDGLRAGDGPDKIAKDLEDVLGGPAAKARALRIARTECTGALNAGAEASRNVLAEDGDIVGKEWLATEDDKVRDEHSEASGQRVKVNEDFTVGGELCSFPGDVRLSPALRVNCRCTTLSVFAEDWPEAARPEKPDGEQVVSPGAEDAQQE